LKLAALSRSGTAPHTLQVRKQREPDQGLERPERESDYSPPLSDVIAASSAAS
jgi:hypothetical protein